MPEQEVAGELVMGWPSRKRIQATTIASRSGKVVAGFTPVAEQEGLLTPTKAFYIVQHMKVPDPVLPEDWSVTVDGLVKRSLKLSLEDLRALPGRSVRMVFECSGSQADFFEPRLPGREKASRFAQTIMAAGEFTGIPLATLLQEAGLQAKAGWVRMEGFDFGKPGDNPEWPVEFHYDKALPLQKALDSDTIVAWAMNGEYLDHIHGAPARVVVPGWSSNWHVKWLRRIEVTEQMPPCYYQTQYYVYGGSLKEGEREEIVSALPVKALITQPKEDAVTWPRGKQVIRGLAWSGMGPVTQVEVSVDGGKTWHAARIEEPREKWMWVRWSLPWQFEPGKYTLKARAYDAAGRVQGTDPRYELRKGNFLSKNYAGIIPVEATVT